MTYIKSHLLQPRTKQKNIDSLLTLQLYFVEIKLNMDHGSNDNEIDDEDLPLSHPARRIQRRADDGVSGLGAWEGEEMELDHQRETERRDRDREESSTGAAAIVTAVDLNQFRNTEVGKGYQAKHVVRQNTASTNNDTAAAAAAAAAAQVRIDAETMVPASTKKRRLAAAAVRMERRADNDTATTVVAVVTKKEELLRNDGLRLFRREIENILSP